MTTQDLFRAIGDVRDDYILDAAVKPKKRRPWLHAIAIAACVCLVVLPVARWWFAPAFQTTEQLLITRPILIGDRFMSYHRVNDILTRWDDESFLALRKGDILRQQGGYTVYRIRGREDIAELIIEEDGKHTLWAFERYSFTGPRDFLYDDVCWFGDLLTDAEKVTVNLSPYTVADILRDVYAATSADDVISVRFEKTYNNNTAVGRSIRPKTVVLRGDDCAPIWDILVTLAPDDPENERWNTPAVPLPDDVLPEQTCRDVTVKFKSGATMTFAYNPAGGEDGGLFWGIVLTVEQNHTLIDLAEISFAPTPIPETDPPQRGAETATAAPLPETTSTPAPETIPE